MLRLSRTAEPAGPAWSRSYRQRRVQSDGAASFFLSRRTRVDQVARALEALGRGDRLQSKVVSSRYTAGLPSVDPAVRAELLAWLELFREFGGA